MRRWIRPSRSSSSSCKCRKVEQVISCEVAAELTRLKLGLIRVRGAEPRHLGCYKICRSCNVNCTLTQSVRQTPERARPRAHSGGSSRMRSVVIQRADSTCAAAKARALAAIGDQKIQEHG